MLFAKFLNKRTVIFPRDSRSGRSRSLTRKRKSRLGAATVEMAMVAPFVFFLIFASVEFARMMMVRQALTNAAREGSRRAALVTTLDHSDAEQVVRDRLRSVIVECDDPDIVRVSISPEFNSSPEPATSITTTVEIDCGDVSWFPTSMFGGASIRGVSSMGRE